LVLSCHDIADGGMASALAEMTFKNSIGCNVNIESDLSPDKILFSETGGFILETLPKNIDVIKSVFSNYGLDVFEIGSTGGQSIEINNITDIYVSETKKAWTNGLREKL
jgi:phosphoribosylformylglycinamidine (FGAM) synthase-like enzyme